MGTLKFKDWSDVHQLFISGEMDFLTENDDCANQDYQFYMEINFSENWYPHPNLNTKPNLPNFRMHGYKQKRMRFYKQIRAYLDCPEIGLINPQVIPSCPDSRLCGSERPPKDPEKPWDALIWTYLRN